MKTTIDWFFDKIKSHFEHDGDLLETLTFTASIAKQKEREFITQEKQKEAIEFQQLVHENYNQCTTGYIHNNWSGDPDKLVIYTTAELYKLFKERKLK